jgi:NAD(P)-dependent dehydrogenase (short-subunit alcohol dehydrogenase family)
VHVADLTDTDRLRSAKDLITTTPNLELLVNNAGFARYEPFTALDPAVATALIGVHVTAPTRLTRAALPAMVTPGQTAVINIASLLAFRGSLAPGPLPFRATTPLPMPTWLPAPLRPPGNWPQPACGSQVCRPARSPPSSTMAPASMLPACPSLRCTPATLSPPA